MSKSISLSIFSLAVVGLLFYSGVAADTFAPVSGIDSTSGTSAELTTSDINRLSVSDDSRMASNEAWPGIGTYDETKYIEFLFSPNIPSDAVITSVTLTHEYRRGAILAGAKLEIWDGSVWHDVALSVPSANATDISETKDITQYLGTAAAVNGLAVRFLAYRDTPAVSATTSHDQIELTVIYALASTPAPTPEPEGTPTSSGDSSGSSATPLPTTSNTPTLSPTPVVTSSPTPPPPSTPKPSPSIMPTAAPKGTPDIVSSSPSPSISTAAKVTNRKIEKIKIKPLSVAASISEEPIDNSSGIFTWLNKFVFSKLTALLSLIIKVH